MRTIRRLDPDELESVSRPLRRYAFGGSPSASVPPPVPEPHDQAETFVAVVDGRTAATVSVESFTQNVRGALVPCAGISRVASHPDLRRGGNVRALIEHVHGQYAERGYVTAALYPFRPSFYTRFGYVTLPRARRLRLELRTLATLPGGDEVECHLVEVPDDDGVAAVLAAESAFSAAAHGSVVRSSPAAAAREAQRGSPWACVARRGGRPVGVATFATGPLGGTVVVDRLLAADEGVRAAILRWFAGHGDQFSAFEADFPPSARPELWADDVEYSDVSEIRLPRETAPMVRFLSVDVLPEPLRALSERDLADAARVAFGVAPVVEENRAAPDAFPPVDPFLGRRF